MRTTIAAVLLFVAVHLHAGTITTLSPLLFPGWDNHQTLTIIGDDLDGNVVVFSGNEMGPYEQPVLSRDAHSVTARVPSVILVTPGGYRVVVRGGASGDSNPAIFEVMHPTKTITIHPQDPVVVPATSPRGAYVTYEVKVTSTSDPNPTLTCTPPSGSLFRMGGTFVQCYARNKFGESVQGGLYVYVYDSGPPLLTLPEDMTVDAEDDTGATVTFEAHAQDALDGPVPVTCTPASGSRFPIGLTTVQCSASDSEGNVANGSFNVTVRKHDKLVIHVPASVTLEAGSSAGAQYFFQVTADGTADPNPEITCTPASGSTFPLGTTIVNCTAVDDFGAHAEGSFEIRVADTFGPELLYGDLAVVATSEDGAEVTFATTANDRVDGEVAVTCTPPSGSTFPIGSTSVQCSASDSRGNTSEASFTVTVLEQEDDEPPAIFSVTASPDVLEPPNHALVPVTITVEVTDDHDPQPRCASFDVTSNEDITGAGSGNTDFDWRVIGELEVELRAERSGQGDGRVYTVHVRCTDASGNSSAASAEVRVPKGNGSGDEPAVITKPTGRRRSVGKP